MLEDGAESFGHFESCCVDLVEDCREFRIGMDSMLFLKSGRVSVGNLPR